MSDDAGVATAGPQAATPAPVSALVPRPAVAPAPVGAGTRGATGPSAGPAPAALGNAAAARAAEPLPAGSVSLAAEEFQPSDDAAALITEKPQQVPVHLGSYARGGILIAREHGGTYRTDQAQYIPLIHPALEPLRTTAGIEPMLRVIISRSKISGHATVGHGNGEALAAAIHQHAGALGWVGIDLRRGPKLENTLGPEGLRFVLTDLPLHVGALLNGKLTFGLVGEAIIFNGDVSIHVAGQHGAVQVARDERGGMSITGDLTVKLGAVAAMLHAYLDSTGKVDVRATVPFQSDRFSGEITVVVADREVAEQLAREQLGVEDAEQQATTGHGAAQTERTRLTQPVPVGWGTLNFAVSDWLAGTAKVIIDPQGHLTVIGDIAPPAEVELFKQRDYVEHLFKFEARASYGIPVVGNVFIFANIGMDALAKLGPGKLHNITLTGHYSTDPKKARAFCISGTITISAFAGLRLRAEGGAGIEILDHDIKVGVGIDGLAGVRGYVEATPAIGMRETGEPAARKTQFYIKGHLEIAAQPFVGLSGDLFVDLDSPWWSPAPDKRWTWPIGSLEYPLPGEFGLGADVDYVLGSAELPEIKFGKPSFDSSKFITDLVNDQVPAKSKGEQNKPGTWKEGEAQGQAPGAGPGAATAGVGAPTGAPSPAPAKGVGGRDQSGKPAPQTAAPGTHPPAHPPSQEHEGIPAPAVEKRWAEGMKELGELKVRSALHPLTTGELSPSLASLKQRYGFSDLHAERSGDRWRVHAAMNPTKDIEIQAFVLEEIAGHQSRVDRPAEFAAAYPVVGSRAAGATRRPRHHIFPQEYEPFFRERGFKGPQHIDRFTVELEEATHQAIHGGGDWRMGRTWPGEWNNAIMRELTEEETRIGHKLEFREVWEIGTRLMRTRGIERNFVPYQ